MDTMTIQDFNFDADEYQESLIGLSRITTAARSRGALHGKLAKAGESYVPAFKPWQPKRPLEKVRLVQDASGEWKLRINGGEPLPASDVEVHLWLKLLEARKR